MLLVQKYGGSSLADVDKIKKVAARVAKARAAGHAVVVVASAMGTTTNELLALARSVSLTPGRRELDMLISVGERVSMALLAMALQELGVPARSFTGSQSGIITDGSHANARVVEVRPDRIRASIAMGEVAIIAGFQGVSREREVTTLGRGGSDTTAVVLAAALQADECEICSDVDGIYSADPRVVSAAVRLERLTLDEALALSRNGAKVLYEEAVAWARRAGVTLRASATFEPGPGTVVEPAPTEARVIAVATDDQLLRGPLTLLPELPTACIRHADAGGLLLDRRNLHAPMPGLEPAATVTAVGARAGTDPHVLRRILDGMNRSETRVQRWRAGADAVVFEVAPADAASAERALHNALFGETAPSGALVGGQGGPRP